MCNKLAATPKHSIQTNSNNNCTNSFAIPPTFERLTAGLQLQAPTSAGTAAGTTAGTAPLIKLPIADGATTCASAAAAATAGARVATHSASGERVAARVRAPQPPHPLPHPQQPLLQAPQPLQLLRLAFKLQIVLPQMQTSQLPSDCVFAAPITGPTRAAFTPHLSPTADV